MCVCDNVEEMENPPMLKLRRENGGMGEWG